MQKCSSAYFPVSLSPKTATKKPIAQKMLIFLATNFASNYSIRPVCYLNISKYSGLPIIRTFRGNRKKFELLGVRVIEGKFI